MELAIPSMCSFMVNVENWTQFFTVLGVWMTPKKTPKNQILVLAPSFFLESQNKWYYQIPSKKVHLHELFEIVFGINQFVSRVKTLFFSCSSLSYSWPKHVIATYDSYKHLWKELEHIRVVYFLTRNTMMVFILLYHERWGR